MAEQRDQSAVGLSDRNSIRSSDDCRRPKGRSELERMRLDAEGQVAQTSVPSP